MNLGQMIDTRADLKVKKALAQREVDALDETIKELEHGIMGAMDSAGVAMASGTKARVVIKEDAQPSVKDWDALYAYIKANDAFFLLQRRVSATAFREATKSEPVPGIQSVTTRSLSITSI